jgi:hypothetical protein
MRMLGKQPQKADEEEQITYIQEQRQNAAQNRQLFLERLEQLYEEIQTWLTAEKLQITQQKIEITEEILGTYMAPQLSISTLENQPLVDIFPIYGFSIVAEGLIGIKGELGKEYIAYLRWGEQTLYNVSGDNWYWIVTLSGNQIYRLNKVRLLQLITIVSNYQF